MLKPRKFTGISTVVLAALAAATSTPLVKSATAISPLVVAGARTGIAALVLLALNFTIVIATLKTLDRRHLKSLVLAGVLLGAHFCAFVAGAMKTSLAAAVALVAMEPVAILVLSFAVLKIRPKQLGVLGVMTATAGALFVGLQAGEGEHTIAGDLLILIAVVIYATYLVVTRQLRESIALTPFATIVFAIASLTGFAFAFIANAFGVLAAVANDAGNPGPSAHSAPSAMVAWACVLGLALVPTAMGHTLIARAARTSSPTMVALVSPGETLGSLIIGAVALATFPTLREGIGAAVIIVGATLTTLAERDS